jgi:hypothetical protein
MIARLNTAISQSATTVLHGRYRGLPAQYLLILLAAVVLCLPTLFTGIPAGYDAPTHVSYQYHFDQQFWKGEYYPRWLAHSNKGYGSPTFFIQYPLPYFITSLLHGTSLFSSSSYREARELGLFCFLVIAASGLAARFWFCKRFSPLASTLAAIVYMSLPYVLSCLYVRATVGELSTFVWMPLAFAMCDSIALGAIGALGFFLALLIMSNPLIACLFVPAMALYILGIGPLTFKSTGHLLALLFAGSVLGVGISAVYLLPFIAYRHLFDPSQMQANLPGFEPGRYFVFLTASSLAGSKVGFAVLLGALGLALLAERYIWRLADNGKIRLCMAVILALGILTAIPNLGSRMVQFSGLQITGFDTPQGFSMGMVITALLTISLGFFSYCRVAGNSSDMRNAALLCTASGAFIFLLPWSAPLWKVFPAIQVVQFPFRSGAILSVAVAGLMAAAINDILSNPEVECRPSRVVVALAVLLTLCGSLLAWRIDVDFRHPRTVALDPNYVDINYRMYVPPDHVGGFAEMLGTNPGSFSVSPTQIEDRVRATFVRGRGTASVEEVGSRKLIVSVDSSKDALLQLSQLYFPLWKSLSAQAESAAMNIEGSPEGLLEMTVPGGKQNLILVIDRGQPERYGIWLSVSSLLVAFVLSAFFRGGRSIGSSATSPEAPPKLDGA